MHFVLLAALLIFGTIIAKQIILLPLNLLNFLSLPLWLVLLGVLGIFSWLLGE